jgi:hypothetical protein
VVDASAGRFVRVPVPYGDTTLPGYLLRPDAAGTARRTLVVTNGSDGSLPGLLGYGGAEALARGWNVFVYDGPGQQSMLFERGVPFRYDWEAVLTPVIDVLVGRSDVDASALAGYGISQGGYWIARAIAFERRLVAAVADPGVVDVSAGWTVHLPQALLDLLDSGQKDAFNAAIAQNQAGSDAKAARTFAFRAKPYGMTDPFDLFTEVRKYQVRDVADRITTPLLITDPDNEQFFPGQPQQLYDLLLSLPAHRPPADPHPDARLPSRPPASSSGLTRTPVAGGELGALSPERGQVGLGHRIQKAGVLNPGGADHLA